MEILLRLLIDSGTTDQSGMQESLSSLGRSYAHLCRIFRKQFGLAPVEYRNLCKLEKACQMLVHSGKSPSEICYAVGFRDPAYFGKMFRRHTGRSPGAYTREMASPPP